MNRVLVVDDELGLLEALGEGLADAGYAVSIARNGREALQRVAEARPDLVLADCTMPVMDGPAFVRALHALDGGGEVPVVMMTALKASILPPDLQLVAVLQKPFGIKALLAIIDKELRRRATTRAVDGQVLETPV